MHKRIKKYELGGYTLGNMTIPSGLDYASLFDTFANNLVDKTNNMLLDYSNAGDPFATYLYNNSTLLDTIRLYGNTNNTNNTTNNIGNGLLIAGLVSDLLGSFIPKELLSTVTSGINAGYDAIADSLMAVPGWGTVAGGIMKIGGLASDGLSALGFKTDLLTLGDLILDSKALKLSLLGLLNSATRKKLDGLIDPIEAFTNVGSSFGGVQADYDEASKYASKYIGGIPALFGEYDKYNNIINNTNNEILAMNAIDKENTTAQILKENPLNPIKYIYNINGGFNNKYIGKNGMKILSKELEFAKAVLAKKGTKIKTIDLLIKYAKEVNPRFIQRMSEPTKSIEFIDDLGNKVTGTHYLGYSTDDKGNAIVYPRIMEDDNGVLQFYSDKEAYDKAILNKDYLIMTPEEAEIFTISPDTTKGYKKGWPEFFRSFKNGGLFNVIPDGALHARKHNLDIDNITKKGIPVITEDELGITLLAEIEVNEIIFRLEVTLKLEELAKEGTDLAAIEAGKLLVKEILHNTVDNTGLIKLV